MIVQFDAVFWNAILSHSTDPLTLLVLGAALQHSPLERIVNVSWDEGLAVEFLKGDNGEHHTGAG